MSDDLTARWRLTLLHPGQAQKEMSHNEALGGIDLILQASAETIGSDDPPEAPAPGQCWIVGTTPTGAWAGRANALAGWTEGGWRFADPIEGTRVWIADIDEFAQFSGGSWTVGVARGRLLVEGVQVVGPRAEAIPDPSGGSVVDAEARAVLAALLAALRAHGLIAP